MGPTVHVELTGPRGCTELIDALRQRGLHAMVVQDDDRCELEIGFLTDPEQRLRSEVRETIGTWLSRSEAPLVLMEADSTGYILRPPGE